MGADSAEGFVVVVRLGVGVVEAEVEVGAEAMVEEEVVEVVLRKRQRQRLLLEERPEAVRDRGMGSRHVEASRNMRRRAKERS